MKTTEVPSPLSWPARVGFALNAVAGELRYQCIPGIKEKEERVMQHAITTMDVTESLLMFLQADDVFLHRVRLPEARYRRMMDVVSDKMFDGGKYNAYWLKPKRKMIGDIPIVDLSLGLVDKDRQGVVFSGFFNIQRESFCGMHISWFSGDSHPLYLFLHDVRREDDSDWLTNADRAIRLLEAGNGTGLYRHKSIESRWNGGQLVVSMRHRAAEKRLIFHRLNGSTDLLSTFSYRLYAAYQPRTEWFVPE